MSNQYLNTTTSHRNTTITGGNNNKAESLEEQSADNGTLLCTTKHSLVLASIAFCTIQFITISLCLITWIHKKDTKFKVRHPIEERLY